MQLILRWFLHSSLPSQDSSVIPSARCTWAKLLSRTCTRLLCNLHKPHQWQPLSHSISPKISNLLSCKHTGQIASKDDIPRSSYFILLPRILGQTIYVEKIYEFLLLSPPETFSIALYHIWQHWYLGESSTAKFLSPLWLQIFCADHLSFARPATFSLMTVPHRSLISASRARFPPCPPPSMHHCWAEKSSLSVYPAPPLRSRSSFLVCPSYPLWLVIALPLLMSDGKWSKQGPKREPVF